MRRHRFMVVDFPKASEVPDIRKPWLSHVLPIHCLLGTYHWVRLDDAHVYVTASYGVATHVELSNHPKVTIMPTVSSGKNIQNHMRANPKHYMALSHALKLDDSHTMEDIIEMAEAKFGAIFSAER